MGKGLDLSSVRVILFDADKTLYDIHTDRAYKELFSFLSKNLDVKAATLRKEYDTEVLKIKTSLVPAERNYSYTFRKVVQKHTRNDVEALVSDASKIFWDVVIKDLTPKKDVVKTIETLSRNHVLLIATDEFFPIVERKLNRIFKDWRLYFREILSCDKVGTMKPSARYYEEAMKLTKATKTEICMVGDSWRRDLEPAKKIGIPTILFSEKTEGAPDKTVATFKELPKLFSSE